MALPVNVPNEFANAVATIQLSQLDANFNTLSNAINGIANGVETLANVQVSGGSLSNVTLSNVTVSGETLDNVTLSNVTIVSGNATVTDVVCTTANVTTGNIATVNATTVNTTDLDLTNIEVTNIKAKDGTAAMSIADSTGKVNVTSEFAVDNLNFSLNTISSTDTNGDIFLTPDGSGEVNISKVDIDAGAIDGTAIGANSASTGKFTSVTDTGLTATRVTYATTGGELTDSASLTFDGTTLTAGGFTTSGTAALTTVNATTVDTTNIEVTNLKAKDGTSAGSIADATGVVTLASSVLTTTDINGGSIDGVTLGTNSAVTEAQIDNINIDGNTISSTDTDGDLNLTPDGTGDLVLDGLKWPQADGTADYVLKTNGSGQLSWTEQTGGGGTPGGSDTQIQYNSSGSFAGASGLVTDGSNLTINAQGDLRFADSDSSNWVAFQAPATVASDVTLTLPDTAGSSGQVLSTNGSGTLSWVDQSGGGGSSISAGDSSVAVTDSGTGKIEFTVDNVEVADFTTGEVVFNETGANQDFRVEGDTNANLLFVDASADRVGIGTNAPTRSLHIVGGSNSLVIERTDATSSALLMVAASNAIEIYARASNLSSTARDLTFYAGGGDNVLSLNANRTIKAYSTVSVGDATPSTSGAGITFPATQSASSDANTLDDYEEGTWTPSVVGTPTNMTSVVGVDGKYVKIGKLVYCEANFTGSITSSTAETEITFALPFTRSGSQMVGSVSLLIGSGADRFGVGVIGDGGVAAYRQQVYIAGNQVNSTGSVGWLRFSLTFTI